MKKKIASIAFLLLLVLGTLMAQEEYNLNAYSAVMADQRLTVFKRNTAGTLTHRFWNGTAWTNWIDLGTGVISSAPSAVMANGRLVVFARTEHRTLTHKFYDNQAGKWTDWIHLE